LNVKLAALDSTILERNQVHNELERLRAANVPAEDIKRARDRLNQLNSTCNELYTDCERLSQLLTQILNNILTLAAQTNTNPDTLPPNHITDPNCELPPPEVVTTPSAYPPRIR
jgi:hypothetical protein